MDLALWAQGGSQRRMSRTLPEEDEPAKHQPEVKSGQSLVRGRVQQGALQPHGWKTGGRGHIFSLGFFKMQSNGGRLKPFPAY